jgi:transcriptional regulator with XRE-family HTH domain
MDRIDYRYSECGLDNVVIHGMPVCTDDVGEEVYCIQNIVGLHKVIAYCIIAGPRGLRPEELRFLRTEMGLTQAELAEIVKKDHQTIGRWERGDKPIDQNAEYVIRTIAAERLGIDTKLSFEELARRCVPSAEVKMIEIDGSDPNEYRLLAA